MPEPGFELLQPDGARGPIIAHVPHASTVIPPDVRPGILLGDIALAAELVRMTDWHTDELYAWTAALGATRFVNLVSRLVADPERFPDDAGEPMAQVGQGAVYTRTSDGLPLRRTDPAARQALLERWFVPYHAGLDALVEATLGTFGRCLVLDCHSFATVPLASEPDQAPDRPDVCIGTDAFHTPARLADELCTALEREGFRVAVNRPFAGALVPLRWYGTDRRVAAVMLETRRGLYCDEATGERLPALADVSARLGRAVSGALGDWG
ncbi:MAG: N-formylglutamate amidohydrolase [Chloroflexota bacterium]